MVDTDLRQNQHAEDTQRRAQRNFTYLQSGQSEGLVDPDIWLTAIYQTGGSNNTMGFSDPQLDAMIAKQRTLFDDTQRKALVKQIILYYIDHGPSTIRRQPVLPAGREAPRAGAHRRIFPQRTAVSVGLAAELALRQTTATS